MLQPGTTVGGRYVVKTLVGRGGMGSVYAAHDQRLGRDVALKVLREDLAADATERARFIREGQIAAQIVHPYVVRTYDAGDDPVGPFLVQELLQGQTLDQVGLLPPRQAAGIIGGIASALAAIHGRGYVHCDIKPQNILLRATTGTPVLLDFGIARAEGAATTTLIATPHYLAPERVEGAAPSAASDIYALGIVLYQAIMGHPPFDASTIHGILQQHVTMPVPPLVSMDPSAPLLDRVIAKMTAKHPQDRYAVLAEIERDLAAIERDMPHAQPTLMIAPAAAPSVATASASFLPAIRGGGQSIVTTWTNAPAWRKRRWIAAMVIPLIALLLGFSIVRGRDAQDADGMPEQSTGIIETTADPQQDRGVHVPELVGIQYSAAEQLLAEHGLVATRGDERIGAAAPGVVLESDPPAATMLPPGGAVTLHISAGEAEPPAHTGPAEMLSAPEAPAPQGDPDVDDEDDDDDQSNRRGRGRDNNPGRGRGQSDR
jgi:eukaryotic-like serine/threonine-protein kinase